MQLPFTIIRTSELNDLHAVAEEWEDEFDAERDKRRGLQQQVYELEDRLDSYMPWWWTLLAGFLGVLCGLLWGAAVAL